MKEGPERRDEREVEEDEPENERRAFVAVIGSDSGAIPEVIADPNLIFPEENSQRLAELIRQLIREPNSRDDMIERNYRHALSLYEVSSLAKRILGVWQNLMRTDVQRVRATEGRNLE